MPPKRGRRKAKEFVPCRVGPNSISEIEAAIASVKFSSRKDIHGNPLKEYTDPDFKGAPAIGKVFDNDDELPWYRTTELEMDGVPSLFVDGVVVDDCEQGVLGDGGLIKAIMLCSTKAGGDIIPNLFVNEWCRPEFGLYVLRFFKEDRWVMVVIDDYVPCRIGTKQPIFAHSKDSSEIWPILVEKAYAKLHGGYGKIQTMGVAYCLRDLTMGRTYAMDLESVKTRTDFKNITTPREKGGRIIAMVFREDSPTTNR